MEPLNN
jgi:hypothetical protein